MIRTRDFLLFVVTFVFILSGIAFTATSQIKSEHSRAVSVSALDAAPGAVLTADTSDGDIDRTQNLIALREKILRGEGEIIQGAPVFTSVDTPSTSVEQDMVTEEANSERSVQYCASKVYSATALLWGLGSAQVVEAEGARVVLHTKRQTVSQGSSTQPNPAPRTVLQMPLRPLPSSVPSCLDSDFVGVSLDGSLINNQEAWRYRSYSAASVIGYARDGFPIYGPGVDEDQLDECGGYDLGTGYQYHIRQNEMFVLGCYRGVPASFID